NVHSWRGGFGCSCELATASGPASLAAKTLAPPAANAVTSKAAKANPIPRRKLFSCLIAYFLLAMAWRSLPRFARVHGIGIWGFCFAGLAQHRIANGGGQELWLLIFPKQREDDKKVEKIIDGEEQGGDHIDP